jgi:predicted HTH transcriptional regulator
MIEGASKMFCQPEVPFRSKIWQEDFRLILEIQVPVSNNTPHKAKDDEGRWKPYIRVKDHTVAVNKILERVWIEKKKATSKPEKFDEDELLILKLIHEHGEVTLSKLYRLSKLPLKKVDKLLVMFICWDLVEICYETDGVYYKSKDDV